MAKSILSLCLFILLGLGAFAQKGTIRGSVTDIETGDALIGAAVYVEGTTTGAVADLDGNYFLELDPGVYQISCSYVSYNKKSFSNIEVKAGEITQLKIQMGEDPVSLKIVNVSAKAVRNTESALLKAKQKSAIVQDVVSSEQFSLLGDNNASGAIKRVTGVSIEGGKYVYVRGLGDRYSQTTLNGAIIPSLDPNRNSVQIDLFPSNLIDNMVVYKTFSPNLPGSFSGGLVDLSTKDFPESFTLQASSSLAFNDQASLQEGLILYEGGEKDWLGMDDGTRAIPNAVRNSEVPNVVFKDGIADPEANRQLDDMTRSFNKQMDVQPMPSGLNQRHSFAIGNQTKLFGRPLGFIGGLSYSNKFQHYDNGFIGRYNVPDATNTVDLNPRYLLNDQRSSQEVLWGALLNVSYMITPGNKLSVNFLRNQSGQTVGRYLNGQWDDQAISEDFLFRSTTLQYLERNMQTVQIRGEHSIGSLSELKVEWMSSYTSSGQDEPDLRFFASDLSVMDGDTLHEVRPAAYAVPARYWRNMIESNFDNKIDFTLPFKLNAGAKPSKLKFGAAWLMKEREFREKRYDYVEYALGGTVFNGNIEDFISDENIGASNNGLRISDASEDRNSYDANQEIGAGYLMADLYFNRKFRVLAGARYEYTNIDVVSLNENLDEGKLENHDVLPALSFTYELAENVNLRLAASRTLARPSFREIAPFSYFKFTGGETEVGNPNLVRTLVDNLDLRLERFPKSGEYLAVSLFYKRFTNPITKTINAETPNLEIEFVNVDQAEVFGIEFEVKKDLESLGLKNFQIGMNASFVGSVVDIDPSELLIRKQIDPEIADTRPLFAQSPYVLNGFLMYQNAENGFSASVSANAFGDRLALVSRGKLPDIYEKGRTDLTCKISKALGNYWTLSLTGRNLLNPNYALVHTFNNTERVYSSYTRGRTISFGLKFSIQ